MENEMGKYPAPPTKEEKQRMRLGKQRIRLSLIHISAGHRYKEGIQAGKVFQKGY